MLLLVGPSLHRLACRLSTAVAATGKVTWQLGGEALQGMRHSLERTRQEAAQGFADRCASFACACKRWAQLPMRPHVQRPDICAADNV